MKKHAGQISMYAIVPLNIKALYIRFGCQRSIVAVPTAKKDGRAEIQTLNPWSGKLLR